MDRFTVWGGTCLAVSCGFLVSALRIYLARRRFLATAQIAAGTVVEVRVRGVGPTRSPFPVLEFQEPGDRRSARSRGWAATSRTPN